MQWSTKHYTQKTKNRATWTPQDIGGELWCCGSVNSSFSITCNWHEYHRIWKSCWTPVCINKYNIHKSVLSWWDNKLLITDSTIVRWCQDGWISIAIHQHWCSQEKGIRLMLDSFISVWNEIIIPPQRSCRGVSGADLEGACAPPP